MLSFAATPWLLGLALVPLMRWLHRGGPQASSVPVSSLLPWRRAATPSRIAGARQPPDPAWRRRALLAALLSVALAGPYSDAPLERVTVWVDDSLSMLTREDGRTRLEAGLAQVGEALAARPPAEVEVRALGRPWRRHEALSTAVIAQLVREAGRREPAAPPAPLLGHARAHWLVTDGADPTLAGPEAAPAFARVFRVGEARRNVGITRLAGRRSLSDPQRLELLIEVTNGGEATEERSLALDAGAGGSLRWALSLPPGDSVHLTAGVASLAGIRVALQPSDALAADDALQLDLAALQPVRSAVDSACPEALRTALRVHPGLAVGGADASPGLAVDCGSDAGPEGTPRIRWQLDRVPAPLPGPLAWSSAVGAADRSRLDALPLRVAGDLAPLRPRDRVLLSSAGRPLVVLRDTPGPPLLETVLEPGGPEAAGAAATPLLVAFLVDRALSGPALDRVVAVNREPLSVRIAPQRAFEATAATVPSAATRPRSWAWPLAAACLLLLLWEIVALLRQWHRLRSDAEAWRA